MLTNNDTILSQSSYKNILFKFERNNWGTFRLNKNPTIHTFHENFLFYMFFIFLVLVFLTKKAEFNSYAGTNNRCEDVWGWVRMYVTWNHMSGSELDEFLWSSSEVSSNKFWRELINVHLMLVFIMAMNYIFTARELLFIKFKFITLKLCNNVCQNF